MASGENKITAQDIFDANIGVAYKNFTALNKEATEALELLRRKISQLNKALNKNKDLDGPIRDLDAATEDFAASADKAEKEARQLGNAVDQVGKKGKKATKGMKGFGGAMKGIAGVARQLLGAAGIVGIGYVLVELTRELYRTSKALESMDLALSKVTKSSYEFNQAQEFLVKISERLGLNILKTAKRYNTFTAAAQQANLTQQESNDIFETFADVGANLALTSDEMGSIFLALEQMLSKGKVSTEELRRQLGEKLPGAMGLMANALGVTTGKLDDMLRKGEVLSADALPKFAKEVEKTFGVDKTKRVETLAAAQERLTNAWVLLIDKINEDGTGLNTVFKTTFGLIEDILESTTAWFDKLGLFLKADLSGWERFWLLVKDAVGADADIDAVIAGEARKVQDNANLKVYQELINVAKEWAELNNQEFDGSGFAEQFVVDGKIADESVKGMKMIIENYKKLIEAQKIAAKASKSLAPTAKVIEGAKTNVLNEQVERTFTVVEDLIRKRILYMQNQLTEDLPASVREGVIKAMQDAQAQLSTLRGGFQPISGDEMESYAQGMNRRNDPEFGQQDDLEGTILGGMGDLEAWGERLTAIQDIAGAIGSIEEELHKARLERIQEEEERTRRKYETLMLYAEGDAEEQSRLRIRQAEELEELDRQRRQIEREQAIQAKEQARIDAVLNAAVASIKIWAKPGWPAAMALQGVIAAQLAASLVAINQMHIPEYAKGTSNHPGGLAIVGDGGRREMIVTPQGKSYLTDDKPQLVSMQSGSRVIADANDYIQKEVIKSIIDQEGRMGEVMTDKITQAIKTGFYGAQINNNLKVNNKFDFMAYRSQRISGY